MLRQFTRSGRVLWTKTNHWGDAVLIHDTRDGALLVPFGNNPARVAKLNANGEGVWTNEFGSYPAGVSSDRRGNVYLGAVVGDGLALAKFNSDGVLLWSNAMPAASFREKALAEDRAGNIYIGVEDRLIKFNAQGIPVWTNMPLSLNIPSISPTHVAVDRHGDVHVTGWSFTGGDVLHLFSAKLTPEGELLWLQSAPLPQKIYADELTPPHFTSVQRKQVTVVQHFSFSDARRVYTFTTQSVRFREPKVSEK
jgi:outer membrane protein assembly factor BamB